MASVSAWTYSHSLTEWYFNNLLWKYITYVYQQKCTRNMYINTSFLEHCNIVMISWLVTKYTLVSVEPACLGGCHALYMSMFFFFSFLFSFFIFLYLFFVFFLILSMYVLFHIYGKNMFWATMHHNIYWLYVVAVIISRLWKSSSFFYKD